MLLFKSMAYKIPARPQKNVAHHKSATFTYTVTINNTNIPLCKKAFCTLYQIGKKKVEYLQQSIKEDGENNNRPHKITDDVKQYIIEHIKLFPASESHYSRNKNPNKKYLSPMLNISKIKIFSTEFNLSFGEPRSDTCSSCDGRKGDEEHIQNYNEAFSLQRIDREYAKSNNGVCYLIMDLQQTLPLPRLTTSKAFYLRQMWMCNLGIHSITKQGETANFFTWTEDVAHCGSSEVCSCLLTMLEYTSNKIFHDNAISHLILWTDSCASQNKNFMIICLYQYLILKGIVKTIDHKFPEVGHSYVDSDRDFGRIEKILRRHENIYLPEEYRTIISQSCKNNHVTDMAFHFRSFEDLASVLNLINRKKNTLGENVPFRDGIKWIRVSEYGSYFYKESFDPHTPFKEVNIIRNSRMPTPAKNDIGRIGKKRESYLVRR
nr:unnamed protein product [Callosobruchus analis]